jgi:hypothetical protein
MSTIKVHATEVRVGDIMWAGGKPHLITRIEPYVHPVVTGGDEWAFACSDGPEGTGDNAWGITLELTNPVAHYYEITERPVRS